MEKNHQETDIVSLGDWIVTLILIGIPGLNVIMLIYWSLNKKTKISKKNYARASLIFIFAAFLIYVIAVEVTTGYFLYKHY